MERRPKLQTILEDLLGSRNVYFQPPANVSMNYPCIVYSRDNLDMEYANNKAYAKTVRYQVTVIDRDPDSMIPDRVSDLPLTAYSRAFKVDGLNHDIFTIYF